MLISQKIGGLPYIGQIYDYGWLWAALIVFFADYGMIYFLMLEEGFGGAPWPWERTFYKTFKWNDTVWFPIIMAMVVVILRDAPKLDGWYTSIYWHIFLLAAGFAISIFMEIGAVKGGQYTMSQEFAPSKLWHTIIFGVVFYWLLSALIPVIVVYEPLWPHVAIIVSLGFVFYNMHLDATLPIPHSAHPEGSWLPWSWHPRGGYLHPL